VAYRHDSRPKPTSSRIGGTVAVAVVAVLLSALFAYHLGKDCGAWEARNRLRGADRPTLCFTAG
jgi:hypothetical protein